MVETVVNVTTTKQQNQQYCPDSQCLDPNGSELGTTCPQQQQLVQQLNQLRKRHAKWIGDEYCNDINNKIDCNYDGGDCCGCNVNKQYNKQYCLDCQNLDPNGSGLGTTCSWQQQLVQQLNQLRINAMQNGLVMNIVMTLDAVGSWQIILPMPNLERPY